MKVNMKGAARNCYQGVKSLIQIIEDYAQNDDLDLDNLLGDLNNSIGRNQPLLSAHVLNCHFNGEGE